MAEQIKLVLEAISLQEQGAVVDLRNGALRERHTSPAGLLRSSGRGDGIPLDDEQEEEGNEEEG